MWNQWSQWRPPIAPWSGRVAADREEPMVSVTRGPEPPTGPPAPRPMEKAPHQDLGNLADDFLGDVQGAGEMLCQLLDQPVQQALNIDGPHRIIDNVLDLSTGAVRGLIGKTLKRGK